MYVKKNEKNEKMKTLARRQSEVLHTSVAGSLKSDKIICHMTLFFCKKCLP